jgi:uncharacterized protein YeaO (DUF488 family)
MTSTKEPLETAYEGRLKCNKCNHVQSKHRFGVDICLHTNCYCLQFCRPGGVGMTIKTKCVYDKPEASDGYRVLIMRKPMMINPALKEFRKVNGKIHERHLIDLSPSAELLKSWQIGTIKWHKFELSFINELNDNPAATADIYKLYEKSKTTDITLLCQEKDGEHCHRYLVKRLIERCRKSKMLREPIFDKEDYDRLRK